MSTQENREAAATEATIYYNAACPICRAEINHYRNRAAKTAVSLHWVDISVDRTALISYGVDTDRIFRRLYAVESSGHLRAGIDAFIIVWERLPGYQWLAKVMKIGWLKGLARFAYDRIAAPALYHWNKRRGVV